MLRAKTTFSSRCKNNAYEKKDLSQVAHYYLNIDWISTHQKLLEGILPFCYSLCVRKGLFCTLVCAHIYNAENKNLKILSQMFCLVRQPKGEKSITSTVSKCRFRIWHAIIYFYSTNDICYLLFLRQETGTHFLKMLAGHVVFSSLPPFRFYGLELKSQHLKTKRGLEMVICKYEFIIPLWQP